MLNFMRSITSTQVMTAVFMITMLPILASIYGCDDANERDYNRKVKFAHKSYEKKARKVRKLYQEKLSRLRSTKFITNKEASATAKDPNTRTVRARKLSEQPQAYQDTYHEMEKHLKKLRETRDWTIKRAWETYQAQTLKEVNLK